MKTFFLRIFQKEVEHQCKFALMANDDIVRALSTHNFDQLWYSVQAFLIAVGNISKLLFSKADLPKRGIELRQSLSVSDDSPLAPRKFRNYFEHFDQRLEKWIISSKRHNFVDSSVITPNSIVGIDQMDYLRNFDPTNFAVTFRGDIYPLKPVIEAVQKLWKNAVVESQKPHSP
jgi:hypothetical protein